MLTYALTYAQVLTIPLTRTPTYALTHAQVLTYALTYAQVLTMPLSRTPRVASTPRAAENTPCSTPPPSAAATPRFLPRANYMAEMPLLMHLRFAPLSCWCMRP